jgi:cytochrome P450
VADVYWDPFDTDLDTDPYDTWRRMRDEAPLYWNERYGFYALSRFADVEAAHRDPRTFCSGHGTVLELMGPEPFDTGQMIFMDPPDHTRLRALVSRAFTPRRIEALEERIRELCRDFFDRLDGRDSFDYVQDFAVYLPSMVISSLLGVPLHDQEMLRKLIDEVFHIEPGVGMVNDRSLTAQIEINSYIRSQLEEVTRHPRDDMLTDLSVAELTDDDGVTRRLTIAQGADFANLLISAGTETVARLLGWASVVLAAHPDQRAELAADAALLPNAVEELLRYEAPSPVQGRWTTADVELHGETVPAGSKVLLLTGSAGRDDRAFPEADRFDIHRDFDLHVSFGYGIHFCLGAALARMEGRIGLEETLRRYPEWEVDHEHVVRLHTSTVRGFAQVPIRV